MQRSALIPFILLALAGSASACEPEEENVWFRVGQTFRFRSVLLIRADDVNFVCSKVTVFAGGQKYANNQEICEDSSWSMPIDCEGQPGEFTISNDRVNGESYNFTKVLLRLTITPTG